mmetsp:Transcript_61038/g.74820  ORF Transcript_61038/g.74820 Transcript_61038/m.74820 type:complete len:161 (+) Transcript_61038:53-535(+)
MSQFGLGLKQLKLNSVAKDIYKEYHSKNDDLKALKGSAVKTYIAVRNFIVAKKWSARPHNVFDIESLVYIGKELMYAGQRFLSIIWRDIRRPVMMISTYLDDLLSYFLDTESDHFLSKVYPPLSNNEKQTILEEMKKILKQSQIKQLIQQKMYAKNVHRS